MVKKSGYIIFIEDWEANSSRRIDIRMKEALRELALWRFAWVVLREIECQWIKPTFPVSLQTRIHIKLNLIPQKLNNITYIRLGNLRECYNVLFSKYKTCAWSTNLSDSKGKSVKTLNHNNKCFHRLSNQNNTHFFTITSTSLPVTILHDPSNPYIKSIVVTHYSKQNLRSELDTNSHQNNQLTKTDSERDWPQICQGWCTAKPLGYLFHLMKSPAWQQKPKHIVSRFDSK